MIVPVAWIEGDWIYSQDRDQNGKFWILDGRIWGPDGAADTETGYWIDNRWIYGPVGAQDLITGFYIQDGWIFGPSRRLPFAKPISEALTNRKA